MSSSDLTTYWLCEPIWIFSNKPPQQMLNTLFVVLIHPVVSMQPLHLHVYMHLTQNNRSRVKGEGLLRTKVTFPSDTWPMSYRFRAMQASLHLKLAPEDHMTVLWRSTIIQKLCTQCKFHHAGLFTSTRDNHGHCMMRRNCQYLQLLGIQAWCSLQYLEVKNKDTREWSIGTPGIWELDQRYTNQPIELNGYTYVSTSHNTV